MILTGLWITLYKLFTRLFGFVVTPYLWWRRARGKESSSRLRERKGYPGVARPTSALVWLHGASVGEALSLMPLIGQLQSAGFQILLTTGTVTSADLAQKRLPPGAIHQFMPLDVPKYVKRFLTHWQPDMVIFAESEIWPNFIFNIHRRNIPLILVNARLSQRSFVRWQKIPGLIGRILSQIDMVLAQTAEDAARLMQLGAARVLVTGNLKFDAPAPPVAQDALAQLTGLIGVRPVWVAASTHQGEEEILLEVHKTLSKRFTNLLTIIVPRHAERGSALQSLAEAQGVRSAMRSFGAQPTPETAVYFADTMGELGLFYRLAGVVFMGGSLIPHGGQNPIEPAKLGSAILYGPHVHNFTEVYALLQQPHGPQKTPGALQVHDGLSLAEALTGLFTDAAKFRAMARAAHEAVDERTGATRNVMRAIEPYIVQLHMGTRR